MDTDQTKDRWIEIPIQSLFLFLIRSIRVIRVLLPFSALPSLLLQPRVNDLGPILLVLDAEVRVVVRVVALLAL